jgi:hypothetical protein
MGSAGVDWGSFGGVGFVCGGWLCTFGEEMKKEHGRGV